MPNLGRLPLVPKYREHELKWYTEGQTEGNGVNASPHRPDEGSPILCGWVKASPLSKSPSVALSGRLVGMQHQSLIHHSPE
ncbi:hypothetical protein CgunFtcFv8_009461 [Champsocephalus gunnari]|nr:hypothetical protein CgunFtcFv8_009461 [Champsocephalus gunnari]